MLQSVQSHEWFGAEWCDGCHSCNIQFLSEYISYVRVKYIGLVQYISMSAADGKTCEVFAWDVSIYSCVVNAWLHGLTMAGR